MKSYNIARKYFISMKIEGAGSLVHSKIVKKRTIQRIFSFYYKKMRCTQSAFFKKEWFF